MSNHDINQLAKLTSIEDIQKIYDITVSEIENIEKEFDSFFDNYCQLYGKLNELNNSIPGQIENILKSSDKIQKSLESASELSNFVSSDLKKLVAHRNALKTEAKKQLDVIELKECTTGIQKSLSADNLESAANYIKRYRQFDKSISDRSTQDLFKNSEDILIQKLNEKIEIAIKSKDNKDITYCCSILSSIGHNEIAIEKYAAYFKIIIDSDIKLINNSILQSKKSLTDSANKLSFSDAISQLLVRFQKRFKKQFLSLVDTLGYCGIAHFIHKIQITLNSYLYQLIDALEKEWPELKNLHDKYEIDIQSYIPLLEQLVFTANTIESHNQFIISVLNQCSEMLRKIEFEEKKLDISSNYNEFISIQTKIIKLLKQGKLCQRLHELLGYYIEIELIYMEKSINIALLESKILPDSNISSSVDDVFYVFKASSDRALATFNVNTISATVNNIVTLLSSTYMDEIAVKSKFSSITRTRSSQREILIGMNNLDLSINYIARLKADILNKIEKMFVDDDFKKIKTCLDEFNFIEKKLNQRLQSSLQLALSFILQPIQDELEIFANVNYKLSEYEYNQYQINDPFMKDFISFLEDSLEFYEEVLNKENITLICQSLSKIIVDEIEKRTMQKKFNLLGGAQFDRDIRMLFSFFSQKSQKSLRDKFARIHQISEILNMESLDEVVEYWENISPNKRILTPKEVKRVLVLRAEFPNDLITKLNI